MDKIFDQSCGSSSSCKSSSLPDVSHEERPDVSGELEQVGMADIEMPVLVADVDGVVSRVPAKISAFVSLDQPDAKGIHMSRLYLELQNTLENGPLTLQTVGKILRQFVSVQKGLSVNSYLNIEYTLPVKRQALKSDETGWRQYPVSVGGELKGGQLVLSLGGRVTYSSTCPCSAALARQLIQEQFAKDFSDKNKLSVDTVVDWLGKESSVLATPHAQRSWADFRITLGEDQLGLGPLDFIDAVEEVLATAVQAAVKRQDEQEFARLNGQNLMFCEDAARRIKSLFRQDNRLKGYWLRVEHSESLHPHSAVSVAWSKD